MAYKCKSTDTSTLHRETTKGGVSVNKEFSANNRKPRGRGKLAPKDMLLHIVRHLPLKDVVTMKMMCKYIGKSINIPGGPSLVLSCPATSKVFFLKIGVEGGSPILEDVDYIYPPPLGSYLCWGAANGLMALHNRDLNTNYLHCPMCGHHIDLPPIPNYMAPKGVYFVNGSVMLVNMEFEDVDKIVRILHIRVYDDVDVGDDFMLSYNEDEDEDINLSWAPYPGSEEYRKIQSVNFSDCMTFVAVAGNSSVILNEKPIDNPDEPKENESSEDDSEDEDVDEGMIEIEIDASDDELIVWPRNGFHIFSCENEVYVCCLLRSIQHEAVVKTKLYQMQSLGHREFGFVCVNNIGQHSVFLGSNQAVVLPSAVNYAGREANTVYIENVVGVQRAFQILAINLESQAVTVLPFPEEIVDSLTDNTPAAWISPICSCCPEKNLEQSATRSQSAASRSI